MAQYSWTVHGNRGNNYQIGLFHGEKEQHVLIYCNNVVISTDFHVREAKTYSLFVDDLLCEVTIEPLADGSYHYDCKINHEADTPLNKMRKSSQQAHKTEKQQRIFLAVGVIVIIALLLLMSR